MERLTIEVELLDSGAKAVLYESLRHGDFRNLQKKLLQDIRVDIDGSRSGGLNAVTAFEENDMVLEMLLKDIIDKDGSSVEDKMDFVFNLSIADGRILMAKVKEISDDSALSAEAKKKSLLTPAI